MGCLQFICIINIMSKQSFQQKVYEVAARIPMGKVATYGQLARMAGSPGAARAVGMCMKHNPDMSIVPCHRVVASDGKLTGYAFGDGVVTKKEMLVKEGVSFVGDRVDLGVSQWRIR
jgi:O-6-methylguanine DNA methyltransferase